LLVDIDEVEWPGNDPSMRRVYFESKPLGQGVPGGMGGGRVTDSPWIHPRLVENGFADAIRGVLDGTTEKLR
jgi:hypothetical protein